MAITGKKPSEWSVATQEAVKAAIGINSPNMITVKVTDDAKENGAALIAAYTAAKALTPNGAALSATNRACVIVPPGKYDLDCGIENACVPLVLDTEFVDIVGLTSDNSLQHVYGTPPATNSGVIVQTANDVHILNLTVEILTEVEEVEGNYAYNYDDTDSAAYWPDTDLTAVIIDNCRFVGDEGATGLLFSMRFGIIYSGTFTSCTGGNESFGAGGTASGTFTSCTGGAGSFGGYGEASGTFTSCTGGDYSFGSGGGTASGTFTSCTGGNYSFGGSDGTASGTFTSCTGGNESFGAGGTASGTFTFCKGGVDSFNNRTLAEGGKIYACVDDGGFIDELVYIP